MTEADPLLIFTPSGRRGRFSKGTTLLDAARSLGVDIDSVCGGRGICGRCQVEVADGEFSKHGITSAAGHVSPPDSVELDYRGGRPLAGGRRLSCTARLLDDALVDVPASSQVHRQVVRKELEVRAFELHPVVRLHYVEVAEPSLTDPVSDLTRLLAALERVHGLTGLRVDAAVLATLQGALRRGNWTATVAVHDGSDVTGIWPGYHDRAFGVAIDVGSTTIAGHLANLADGSVLASAGVMNPQIRFGEDLMSRVSYAMMHDRGAAEMTKAVRVALRALIADLARDGGVASDEIVEVVLVGNPVMHHLFLGLDPIPLGQAPFALGIDRAVRIPATPLHLGIHPGARLYVLPCIAGHVGADTAGVILAEQPQDADPITLIVDVGTNAEIVLGNRERLVAASSPTGPAFEGAQISSGQRAAPGAIERVRIDPQTLEPRFRVIGSSRWSDDPFFAEETAATGVTGICGSGIIEVVAELYLAGLLRPDGVVDGRLASRTPRLIQQGRTWSYVLHDGTPQILVTQMDVRAIQLAKSALYAGVRLLMDVLGIDALGEIKLAGAFGSHIDVKHAMVLGLVPDCDLAHVRSVGNAAGAGALIALLSADARREIEAVVRRVEKVETAAEERFQEHFVDALAIPHATASYPNLSAVVTLPRLGESPIPDLAPSAGGRRSTSRRG